ncbi:MAG: hypothetical protein IH620_05525 [Ignavibacterium sp.]|nr:hypothetical protein [Ignavibacterium sp.]
MKTIFYGIIFSLLVTGCSATYVVTSNSTVNEPSVVDFNEFATGREADIFLIDETVSNAKGIQLTADSLYWKEGNSIVKRSVIKSNVRKVIFTNHFIGALEGWGFGLVSGGAAGLLSFWAFGQGDVWAFLGLTTIGLIVGAVAGIITGSIIGQTYEYNFEKGR